MVRALFFIFALFPFKHLMADEGYTFYRLDCNTELSYLHISTVTKYNISNIIWPHGDWNAHENNLKKLEEKYGLHVFGAAYGRFPDESFKCNLGSVNITLRGNKIAREIGRNKETVYYQSHPTMLVTVNDKLVYDKFSAVGLGTITVDVGERYIMINRCLDNKECKDETLYFSDYNL
ncbi:hypothetical protein [Shewanella sp.]|jgi:hypothetical protein|uniref:hypothetical protein n=1 Tax=Shewanella sp. TaxID=50422 RepID=UPI0040483323